MPSRSPFAVQDWHLAHGRLLQLGPQAVIMGVLNVTPDSFSDGGEHDDFSMAVQRGRLDGIKRRCDYRYRR